jgi:hypothetical protein
MRAIVSLLSAWPPYGFVMSRTSALVALTLALLMGAVSPAFAKPGDGGAGNSGQGGGQGKSGGGQGPGNSGGGQGKGSQGKGNGPSQNAPGEAAGPDKASNRATVLDDAASLAEIRAGRALPLERIMTAARVTLRGKIIDVRLLRWRRSLVYEVKALNAAGRVENSYLHAGSGKLVTN